MTTKRKTTRADLEAAERKAWKLYETSPTHGARQAWSGAAFELRDCRSPAKRRPTFADLEQAERVTRHVLEITMSDQGGLLDGPLVPVNDTDGDYSIDVYELRGFAIDLRQDAEAWAEAVEALAAARAKAVKKAA